MEVLIKMLNSPFNEVEVNALILLKSNSFSINLIFIKMLLNGIIY